MTELLTTISNAMTMFKKIEIMFRIILRHVNEGETLISNNILKRVSKSHNKEYSSRTFTKEFTIDVSKNEKCVLFNEATKECEYITNEHAILRREFMTIIGMLIKMSKLLVRFLMKFFLQ